MVVLPAAANVLITAVGSHRGASVANSPASATDHLSGNSQGGHLHLHLHRIDRSRMAHHAAAMAATTAAAAAGSSAAAATISIAPVVDRSEATAPPAAAQPAGLKAAVAQWCEGLFTTAKLSGTGSSAAAAAADDHALLAAVRAAAATAAATADGGGDAPGCQQLGETKTAAMLLSAEDLAAVGALLCAAIDRAAAASDRPAAQAEPMAEVVQTDAMAEAGVDEESAAAAAFGLLPAGAGLGRLCGRYRVDHPAVVRQGCQVDSAPAGGGGGGGKGAAAGRDGGGLSACAVITALDLRPDRRGVLRLRYAGGWLSCRALDGTPLFRERMAATATPEERLQIIAEVVDQAGLSRFDVAIRQWARQNPKVRRVWRAEMEKRIAHIRGLFAVMGFEDDELEMRTRTFVAYQTSERDLFAELTIQERERIRSLQISLLTRSD